MPLLLTCSCLNATFLLSLLRLSYSLLDHSLSFPVPRQFPIGLLSSCQSSVLDQRLLHKRPALPLYFDPNEVAESSVLTGIDNEWIYNREKSSKEDEDDEDEEEDD